MQVIFSNQLVKSPVAPCLLPVSFEIDPKFQTYNYTNIIETIKNIENQHCHAQVQRQRSRTVPNFIFVSYKLGC